MPRKSRNKKNKKQLWDDSAIGVLVPTSNPCRTRSVSPVFLQRISQSPVNSSSQSMCQLPVANQCVEEVKAIKDAIFTTTVAPNASGLFKVPAVLPVRKKVKIRKTADISPTLSPEKSHTTTSMASSTYAALGTDSSKCQGGIILPSNENRSADLKGIASALAQAMSTPNHLTGLLEVQPIGTSANVQRLFRSMTITNSKFKLNEPLIGTAWRSKSQCRAMSTSSSSDASGADVDRQVKEGTSGEGSKNSKQTVEQPTGKLEKLEFQAETKMLLEIVAKSLYSEQEIFIRELISNASDALEKFRFLSTTSGTNLDNLDRALEINVSTDKTARTITIQDSGLGMTKDELISNLGTIARSGSKAFLESLKESQEGGGVVPNTIIGKFGVGFYSCFMVANKVDVYTHSAKSGCVGYKWSSDGTGSYEIQEAKNVEGGTKIVIHLKPECREFALEETVMKVIKKYSNFVGSPIKLNGQKINTVGTLWLKDPKSVEHNLHDDFYRFISGSADLPRFTLHFLTDVPVSVRCLLYFPESAPGMFDAANAEVGVALYSKNVLIMSKADSVIPVWLRFLKGVVDSEDIPLNLSRELLQEGTVIRRVRRVVINRVLRFLHDMARKKSEQFIKFYQDYGFFLMEGIMLEPEQQTKEEIGKLLRFETSMQPAGHNISLAEYLNTHKSSDEKIYYLCAPSRSLADSSPYLDAFKSRDTEVLFCFNPHDEMILNQLGQFDGRKFSSIETEMWLTKEKVDTDLLVTSGLTKMEAESLSSWFEKTLKGQAASVSFTQKLETHPCAVTVRDMAAARHFLKLQKTKMPSETLMSILQPRLELNAKHPIVKKLITMKDSNADLAKLVADHMFKNAMVEAGLDLDARQALAQANNLLLLSLSDSSSSKS